MAERESDEAKRARALVAHRRTKGATLKAPPRPKLPKSVGARIDALYTYREAINAFGREVRELERIVSALRDEQDEIAKGIARDLRAGQLEAGRGEAASFSPGSRPVVTVTDWEAFYKYIRKQDAFELLHRRVTTDAVVERLDKGEKVPGVEREAAFTYSLTKVGAGRKRR